MKLTATTSLATNDWSYHDYKCNPNAFILLAWVDAVRHWAVIWVARNNAFTLLPIGEGKWPLLCLVLPRLLLFKSTDAQTETPRQHLCLEQLELNVLLITASERKKATDLCGAPFSKWWWNRKKVLFLNNHACCFLDLSTWLAYMSCLVLCLLPQLSTFPSILSLN